MRNEQDCNGALHPKAIEGIELFNEGKFFEAHEELEIAWNEEAGAIRDLYRGILQVAVAYLHITRGNYNGAVKVYGRSLKWTQGWNDVCRGINVKKLRGDAQTVMQEVKRLGKDRIREFDPLLFKPIQWNAKRLWICDRCGSEMYEKNCKVACPNCGNRFDCSDLNLYFD
jgi:predicted metal-dependent hydrolase